MAFAGMSKGHAWACDASSRAASFFEHVKHATKHFIANEHVTMLPTVQPRTADYTLEPAATFLHFTHDGIFHGIEAATTTTALAWGHN